MDHSADAQRTDLMTITRFVLNEQSKQPEARGDFSILLSHIVLGCKFVCSAVNKVILSYTHHFITTHASSTYMHATVSFDPLQTSTTSIYMYVFIAESSNHIYLTLFYQTPNNMLDIYMPKIYFT